VAETFEAKQREHHHHQLLARLSVPDTANPNCHGNLELLQHDIIPIEQKIPDMAPPGRRFGLAWLTAFVWLSSLLVVRAEATGNDESVLISEIGRQNNQSLLWGPYKPNLYFGVRPRIPLSLSAALMWGRVDTYSDMQTCELHPFHRARLDREEANSCAW
jgi:hypothetical protein